LQRPIARCHHVLPLVGGAVHPTVRSYLGESFPSQLMSFDSQTSAEGIGTYMSYPTHHVYLKSDLKSNLKKDLKKDVKSDVEKLLKSYLEKLFEEKLLRKVI
jgi:hypothetical protein